MNNEIKRFFSAGKAALSTVQEALSGSSLVRIATAYFEPA
jgi:hypothetical protein